MSVLYRPSHAPSIASSEWSSARSSASVTSSTVTPSNASTSLHEREPWNSTKALKINNEITKSWTCVGKTVKQDRCKLVIAAHNIKDAENILKRLRRMQLHPSQPAMLDLLHKLADKMLCKREHHKVLQQHDDIVNTWQNRIRSLRRHELQASLEPGPRALSVSALVLPMCGTLNTSTRSSSSRLNHPSRVDNWLDQVSLQATSVEHLSTDSHISGTTPSTSSRSSTVQSVRTMDAFHRAEPTQALSIAMITPPASVSSVSSENRRGSSLSSRVTALEADLAALKITVQMLLSINTRYQR